jgi:protein TonB
MSLLGFLLPAILPVMTTARPHFSSLCELQRADEKSPSAHAAPRQEPVRTSGAYLEGRVLRRVEPVYPAEARARRVAGVVLLQVIVNEKGEAYEVKVVRGHPLLDMSAVDAVRQWRFKPTQVHGKPVPVLGTIAITFDFR